MHKYIDFKLGTPTKCRARNVISAFGAGPEAPAQGDMKNEKYKNTRISSLGHLPTCKDRNAIFACGASSEAPAQDYSY